MSVAITCDEDLVRRLPLPLAQLLRRAHNAKTPLERHQAAYYLWEASLRLLGAVCVTEYAAADAKDPKLAERLHALARPSLGHWWEFVRLLLPALADGGDQHFAAVRDLVLGKVRDDLPRTAGLDAALGEALDGRSGARSTVRLSELFDRLVRYRNRELGHGAAGQRSPAFYDSQGRALLAGTAELLGRLDVLAGRRLLHVADVRLQSSGAWLVERYELIGETARRLESLELPAAPAGHGLLPGRLYLGAAADGPALRSLSPLIVHDPEANETLFLSARRGQQRTEYLSYSSGRVLDRKEGGGELKELVAHVLGRPVEQAEAADWAARSRAEEEAASPPADDPHAAACRHVGEFDLLSTLGRGGMGVVYRAWQPSLGRQVALKCLLRTGDPKAEVRFAREIRALGRVEHPNLVKIFTSGSEGDRWFYAMELIEGATLAAVCERLQSRSPAAKVDLTTWQEAVQTVCAEVRKAEQPVSDPQTGISARRPAAAPAALPPAAVGGRGYVRHVVDLVAQVAGAAHVLHEAGVLHRDIKPGNVMVTADGAQAVLMDLGLAQLADDVQGRLTRTRQFVGTLRYSSPEQVLAVGGLDRRSDVYSVGATLWEMLTLRPMYAGTEQTPTPELMRRIQYEEPESVRKHNPAVTADLEAIVHRCLQKDPKQRYATAQELADDLQRFRAGEPVRARTVGGWERGVRWVKRRPAAAALLAVSALAVLAVVAGAVGLVYSADLKETNKNLQKAVEEQQRLQGEADQQRAEADRQRAEADRQRDRAEGIQYLTDMNLAQRAWRDKQFPLMLRLLERYQPRKRAGRDLRGFEWYYLWQLSHAELLALYGHTGAIWSVAFSPDGTRLASASGDGLVKVWDVRTGQVLCRILADEHQVRAAAFSPDGKRLATGGDDKTVKVWHADTGEPALTLKGHDGTVWCLAFSADGKRLASGSGDKTVKLWDADTGKEVKTLAAHTASVYSLVFSPDGRRLASGSADWTTKIWETETGTQALPDLSHGGTVWSVAFSRDGKRLAGASGDKTVKLWDADTGKEVKTLAGHTGVVWSVAFSPDGRRLASGSDDQTVRIWDVAIGKEVFTIQGHVGPVYGVAFAPDGQRLASGSADKAIKVWDATAAPECFAHSRPGATSVAYSPDGKWLASAGTDNAVKVWELATGKELALEGHTGVVTVVAFSPDGRLLASAGKDNCVKIWDAVKGGQALRTLGHSGAVRCVAFNRDGKRLASAGEDRLIKIWDTETWQEVYSPLQGHTGTIWDVAFTPDGKRLASGSDDMTVKIWDAETGKEFNSLTDYQWVVYAVAYSSDGQWLAVAGADKAIHLVDRNTARDFQKLEGHRGAVACVAFSPDSRRLASAGYDGAVKLWDVATGQEMLSLDEQADWAGWVAFSPDGKQLATTSRRDIKVWDAAAAVDGLTLAGHTAEVAGVAFSPDRRHLASCGWDKTVRLWDLTTWREVGTLRESANWFNAVAFSPDGRRLAAAGWDFAVRLWDVEGRSVARTLPVHRGVVAAVAYRPDGLRLASASWDGTARVWDPATGAVLFTAEGHTDQVNGVALSPDGDYLVTCSGDKSVRLWALAAGRRDHTFSGHTNAVVSVALSPDARRLASASMDGTVKVWDPATGDLLLTYKGHAAGVWSVAFSPDGKQAVSGGVDRVVRVWDPATGADIRTFGGHTNIIWCVAFSPDGKRIASASQDRTVKIWNLDEPTAESAAARRAGLLRKHWLDWHRTEAAESARDSQWSAAAFHLNYVIAADPTDTAAYRERANAAAEAGQWDRAGKDAARAVVLNPDDHSARVQQAYLRLQAGDAKSYGQACKDLLHRFGDTTDPAVAGEVARLCTLLPEAVSDYDPVVRLAERAAAGDPKNGPHGITLAAALYRAGWHESPLRKLTDTATAFGHEGRDRLLLAMACARLGLAQEAKDWLKKGQDWIDNNAAPGSRLPWTQRLEMKLLRAEAEAVVKKATP